jgi:hypothetical protein
MLFGFNLSDLLLFSFQDENARKHFLVGCLVYLTGLFIPILPWFVAAGYCAILVRQVLNGEKPHMVPWENWETLFKEGAMLFGIRLIYSAPLLLLLLVMFLASFSFSFLPLLSQGSDSQMYEYMFLLSTLTFPMFFLLMMPLSLAIGLIVPAAEIYAIEKESFTAGFQVREWWSIFKANWAGFLLALAIVYSVTMVITLAAQFLAFTIVLFCLLPLILPVISMYALLVQYTAFAQAYKEGRDGRTQLAATG